MAAETQRTEGLSLYRLDLCHEQIWLNTVTMIGCSMIIMSPFVSYYVNGHLNTGNWLSSLYLAIIGIVWIVFEDVRFRRNVPEEIRHQRTRGKLYKPLQMPTLKDSLTYMTRKLGTGPVLLNEDGVFISSHALIRASWSVAKDYAVNPEQSQRGVKSEYLLQLKWHEIKMWEMRGGANSAGYFLVYFNNGQFVELRRPCAPGIERAVLDYVRGVGQCSVRLFDDAR